MNRLLWNTVGAVVVAGLAFAAIVISTGGRPGRLETVEQPTAGAPSDNSRDAVADQRENPPLEPPSIQPTLPTAADSEQMTPATSITEDAEARAIFENVAQSLRTLEFEISAATVGYEGSVIVATDLNFASLGRRVCWRWVMAKAYLERGEADRYALTSFGRQTVTLTSDSRVSTWSGPVERMNVDIETRPRSLGATVRAATNGLSLQGENGATPLSLATGRISLNLTDGSGPVSPTTVSSIELSDLVLPALAGAAFGPSVNTVNARVDLGRFGPATEPAAAVPPSRSGQLSVIDLGLEWGALQLTGKGRIGLDTNFRPAGRFEVRLGDVLRALDAVHAANHLDRDTLAQTYARLLREMVTIPAGQPVPFIVEVRDGKVILLGAPYGFSDIELANVRQILRDPAAGHASP